MKTKTMKKEKALLIKTERLGMVEEITTFLNDIEISYNNIYRFNQIVNAIQDYKYRPRLNKMWKNTKFHKMPHEDKLSISSVWSQSPGEWKFKGVADIIHQLKEIFCRYRYRQEKEMGDLEIKEKKLQIFKQKLDILKEHGYSESELQKFVANKLGIQQLLKHEERGLIDDMEVVDVVER
jgi:hypothetical protein